MNKSYSDIIRTSKLSNRTYTDTIKANNNKTGTIYSEGAWKIGIAYLRFTGGTGKVFLEFEDGLSFYLQPTDSSDGKQLDPDKILWLDGNVNTVRDDEINYTMDVNVNSVDRLIVFKHRIVEKKDDNIYPAQNPNL